MRRRAGDNRGVDGGWVGRGTALADDPELTARSGGRVVHRPVRVVADTRLLSRPARQG